MKPEPLICKAVVNGLADKVDFSAPTTSGQTLADVIEDDKRYGVFHPANGEYFTWKVFDGDDEFDNKKAIKSIQKTIRRFEVRLDIKFKYAKEGEVVDFKIHFHTVEEDRTLTSNVLMYHYFPINDLTNPFRGVCVVNKDFNWTTHGRHIPIGDLDPDNPFPTNRAKTYDFDAIYTHEMGHGLGLPHSKLIGQVMAPNAGIMSEWLTEEEDLPRLWAKYPKRILEENILKRWLRWIKSASDR
jgi:hypothetical protein